jgi:hypothetical protein
MNPGVSTARSKMEQSKFVLVFVLTSSWCALAVTALVVLAGPAQEVDGEVICHIHPHDNDAETIAVYFYILDIKF